MKYAVYYVSLFDNELRMVIISASSLVDAINVGLRKLDLIYNDVTGFEDCTNLEEIQSKAFDEGLLISAIAINSYENN